MQIFKRFFNFYINGSIHVALAALSMVSMTLYFCTIPNNFDVKAFVFFGTIVGYNFVKYDALTRLNKITIRRELQFIIGLSLCSAIASIYYFLKLYTITQAIGIIVFILLLLYTLPFFPNKQNARNWRGIKIYIVSFCWVCVTVLLPIINAEIPFTGNVILLCIQRFVLVFVLVLIFEIIDFNTDDPHLKTVPQQIGIRKTKLVGYLLLSLLLFLEFLYQENQGYTQVLLNSMISIIIALFLYFANENRSRYYASFWVESIPVFWWILLYFVKTYLSDFLV